MKQTNSEFCSGLISDNDDKAKNNQNNISEILSAIKVLDDNLSSQSAPIADLHNFVKTSLADVADECKICCKKQDEDTGFIDDEVVDIRQNIQKESSFYQDQFSSIRETVQSYLDKSQADTSSFIKETRDKISGLEKQLVEMEQESQKNRIELVNTISHKISEIEMNNHENIERYEKSIENISSRSTSIREQAHIHTTHIDGKKEEVSTFVDDTIKVLQNGLENIAENKNSIKTFVSTLSINLTTSNNENSSKIQSFQKNVEETIELNNQTNSEANVKENDLFNDFISKTTEKVLKLGKDRAELLNDQESKIQSIVERYDDKLNDCIGDINKRSSEVEKLLSNELIKDFPSGLTPSRREYSYPRILSATSPHERILQRIRNNTSLKTPLPVNCDFEVSNYISHFHLFLVS